MRHFIFLCALSSLAFSANSLASTLEVKTSDWRLNAGAGGKTLPKYEGSAIYKFEPLPLVDLSYRNIVGFGTMNGLVHGKIYNSPVFSVSAMLDLMLPSKKNAPRYEQSGLGFTTALKGQIGVEMFVADVKVTKRFKSAAQDGGIILDSAAGARAMFWGSMGVKIQATLALADSTHLNDQFGNNEARSSFNGLLPNFHHREPPNFHHTEPLDFRH